MEQLAESRWQARKGTIIVALTVSFAFVFVWFLVLQGPRDPVYNGERLSAWVRNFAPSSSTYHSREWNEADTAVRHIGTNCFPVLCQMLRAKDSALKLHLVALLQKQRLIKPRFVPAAELNVAASRAFIALGAAGKDAVPGLLKIYNQNVSLDSKRAVLDAISWIGPSAKPALPLLLQATIDGDPRVRANALWALGEIHAEPEKCVPLLIQALKDTKGWGRECAAHALGMFGADAQTAVPALVAASMADASGPVVFVGTGWEFSNRALRIYAFGTNASGSTVYFTSPHLEVRKALQKIDPLSYSIVPAFGEFGLPAPPWPVPQR